MSTPAGWYDDGHGTQRWWDGAAWTEHVAPAASEEGTDAVPAASAQPHAAYPATASPTAGYPGAPGSAASPEAPKPKSKLWILWVVLGGVVLVLGIAAAILIPLLIGLFSSAGGAGTTTGSTDDERSAVEVVRGYDEAFDDSDCDLYEEVTTSAFRDAGGYADCAAFESGAATFDDNTDDYEVEVTGVTTESDGTITVTTVETYLSYIDADGNETDVPEQAADPFVYTLVDGGGRWAIDDVQ